MLRWRVERDPWDPEGSLQFPTARCYAREAHRLMEALNVSRILPAGLSEIWRLTRGKRSVRFPSLSRSMTAARPLRAYDLKQQQTAQNRRFLSCWARLSKPVVVRLTALSGCLSVLGVPGCELGA
jgi:hypothetical protein